MVERQIRQRGVTDTRVLSAMETIPRERFVPPDAQAQAYEDVPLAIGFNQTISQPYIVAYMTEVLDVRYSHRVLEIGTGSAYQAAVLGKLAREVWTVEIVPELAAAATGQLRNLGLINMHVRLGKTGAVSARLASPRLPHVLHFRCPSPASRPASACPKSVTKSAGNWRGAPANWKARGGT